MRTYTFAEAKASFKKYPYFVVPAVSALASSTTPEERTTLCRRIAAAIGDEATLRNILGIDPEEFARFYPDMLPPELTTDDAISSFISRFSNEKDAEAPEIEEIVAAPAIDYASMLANDTESDTDEMPADPTADAISGFLAAVPPKVATKKAIPTPNATEPPAPKPQAAPQQSIPKQDTHQGELSEALLKVMIKNKNYSKALEIINELNLNNPKKSIYFADQMRFIKKLIQIQEKSR